MQIVANIFFLSAFYLSFSIGLALIFGTMRVINYTHGEMYMLGAYTIWAINSLLRGTIPSVLIFIIALVVAMTVIGLLGVILQKTVISRLQGNTFSIFMATLGLSYVLQVVMIEVAGPIGKTIIPLFPGIVRIGTVILPIQRLVICGVTLAVVTLLGWFLLRTNLGRAIRATAQNRSGALLQGVDIPRIESITMFLGCALAATSGVLMAGTLNINPFMGGDAIWRSFIIIIVGGIGSLPGAALASVVFGALDTVLTVTNHGQFSAMIDALIMILILAFRPNGLLGVRE
ncbi:amino acid/amide ABC transporter membrane protein 1, HAAT family [Arboricoccus pini]|uniref:Amino acid/amide ABC transporter membrane protein 1, HAAT family n=1 Tax=Arboricoccus pini TaxID=1963835 RepID=A0A212Q0C2_9PROT|nr:branched-chain amino acid ABC transporter permease [Arboricoccus pini]SNB52664.1 amino acid/amide ABC transporter membrane protein 1, HAAT family [Arboricoccus pini]